MLTQFELVHYLPQKQWENQAKEEYGFSHFKKKLHVFPPTLQSNWRTMNN